MSIAMAVQQERRLFPRLNFKNKSLVVAENIVGLVQDVSLGGISFSYYQKDGKTLGDSGFDIVSGSGVFSVLPGDYAPLTEVNCSGASNVSSDLRSCRVRFLNISAAHLAGFWSFLKEQCQPGVDQSHVIIDGSVITFPEIEAFVSANRKNVSLKGDMVDSPIFGKVEQGLDYGCLQKETCLVA